jgi:hypothetical protein
VAVDAAAHRNKRNTFASALKSRCIALSLTLDIDVVVDGDGTPKSPSWLTPATGVDDTYQGERSCKRNYAKR